MFERFVFITLLCFIFNGCSIPLKKTNYILIQEAGLNRQTTNLLKEIGQESTAFFKRDILFVQKPDSRLVKIEYGDLANDELGVCECDGFANSCTIILTNKVSKDQDVFNKKMKLVLYHEIGHSFGLGHSPKLNDIMNETVKIKEVNKEQIKEQLLKIKSMLIQLN